MKDSPPLFILYGGELINVRIIGRAHMQQHQLRIEFTTGGFTILEGDVSVEGLADTINKL